MTIYTISATMMANHIANIIKPFLESFLFLQSSLNISTVPSNIDQIISINICSRNSNKSDIYKPKRSQISSILAVTAGSFLITRPHSRSVSPGHLLVASKPILPPSPLTGLAKSR